MARSVEAQMRAQVDVVPGNFVVAVDGRVVEGPNDPHANGSKSSMEQ